MSSLSRHPDFNDPLADIVLRSSDEVEFEMQKKYLVLTSEVLEDMINFPSSDDQEGARGTLSVVRMAENAEELHLLLLFLDRDASRPAHLPVEQAVLLLELSDKYGSKIASDFAALHLLKDAVWNPLVVCGAAVAFRKPEVARAALQHFDTVDVYTSLQKALSPSPRDTRPDNIDRAAKPTVVAAPSLARRSSLRLTTNLDDIPRKYLERFSLEDVLAFNRVREAVAKKEGTWEQLAGRFQPASSKKA